MIRVNRGQVATIFPKQFFERPWPLLLIYGIIWYFPCQFGACRSVRNAPDQYFLSMFRGQNHFPLLSRRSLLKGIMQSLPYSGDLLGLYTLKGIKKETIYRVSRGDFEIFIPKLKNLKNRFGLFFLQYFSFRKEILFRIAKYDEFGSLFLGYRRGGIFAHLFFQYPLLR